MPFPSKSILVTKTILRGHVDLVRMKAIIWNEANQGMTFVEQDIPAELLELAQEWREKCSKRPPSQRRAHE